MALAACGTTVPVPADPLAALDLGQSLLEDGRSADASSVLESLDRELFVEQDRARLDALRMQAFVAESDYWSAHEVAREFAEEHRFTDYSTRIEQLEFAAGKTLIQAGDGDGEAVLQHFIAQFPTSPLTAEALKLLGEWSFSRGRYQLAELRFTELLRSNPTSEWAEFARFRLALTSFRRVTGWEYDLDRMTLARNELTHYVASDPERPEFRTEAEAALATLEAWIARRHVSIADFYKRVGNEPGQRFHLEIAARDFADTRFGERAAQRLEKLGPAPGVPQ